jgi:hypothetical protein
MDGFAWSEADADRVVVVGNEREFRWSNVTSQNSYFGMWTIFHNKFKFSKEFHLISVKMILFDFILYLNEFKESKYLNGVQIFLLNCSFIWVVKIFKQKVLSPKVYLKEFSSLSLHSKGFTKVYKKPSLHGSKSPHPFVPFSLLPSGYFCTKNGIWDQGLS